MMQNETELAEHVRASDYAAFDELYQRFAEILYRIALQKVEQKDDALDIVQDVFVNIWDKRESFIIKTSLKAYMVACVYNRVFNHFRKKGVAQDQEEDFKKHFESYGESETSYSNIINNNEQDFEELLSVIEEAIHQMPDKMKQVFLANQKHKYSIAELADNFNIAPQTVKNHLQAAQKYLRKAVGEVPSSVYFFAVHLYFQNS